MGTRQFEVVLKVSSSPFEPSTSVVVNGSTYYYYYTGGTDGYGGVAVVTGTGSFLERVSLSGSTSSSFEIISVSFSNDTYHECTASISGSRSSAMITDQNSDSEAAYFSVTVRDKNHTNNHIACDPPITSGNQ
jgi:hypothetical protein